jgi:hypothetical protein
MFSNLKYLETLLKNIMWFLNGRPDAISVQAVIYSICGGYQKTKFQFQVTDDADTEKKFWIAVAFPWAPNKSQGGLKLLDHKSETVVEGVFNNADVYLQEQDVKIWERLRSLKVEADIELVHVQELVNWYLDDIGVITLWIESGKTYQLCYEHKIASDSCLFFPSRLPTIIASRQPKMDYRLWVVNGLHLELPKFLQKVKQDVIEDSQTGRSTVVEYQFKEWEWDEDTRIHTDNWASSDDELESSAEE